MKDFFQSAWTIGIGTGIISGIIVYFFSNFIAKIKNNSAHIEQINQANKKIISILTPFIANNGLPNIEIINSVISSVARQTLLNSNELFSVKVLCEELIREVMDNIYISIEKKREYSKVLKEYMESVKINDKTYYNEIAQQFQNIENNNKNKYQKNFSIVVALITTILISIGMFLISTKFTNFFDIVMIASGLIAFIISIFSFDFAKTKKLKEFDKNIVDIGNNKNDNIKYN